MENYKLAANKRYNTIGMEIDMQIKVNPELREIRFVKDDEEQLFYNVHTLIGTDIPAIENADFVNVAPSRNLGDILKDELKEDSLPKEVRVIRPNHSRDSWGIFFKQ